MAKQEKDVSETEPEKTSRQTLYSVHEGLPTAPDVAVLQKAYPDLKPGDQIPYGDVAEWVGIAYGGQRWKTITDAWRRREEEKGIVIGCMAGEAFLVLTADQISANTYGTLRHIGRSARKQRKHLATIRGADDDMQRRQVHQMSLLNGIERESKKARMNLLPSTETKATPRITPPEQKTG